MHCYKIFARAPARESNTHANVRINLMHPELPDEPLEPEDPELPEEEFGLIPPKPES